MQRLFVGNLPYQAQEDEIRELFSQYGTVHSVRLISDRETGRPRGFGFVDMDPEEAKAAIAGLDGQDYGGRPLRVNEARPRENGGGGGGGGGGGRGGGGGGGGRGPRGPRGPRRDG